MAVVNLKVVSTDQDAASSEPLSVVVEGEDVVVLDGRGGRRVLNLRAAQLSATRLLDAIAIAKGQIPSLKSETGLIEKGPPPPTER